VTKGGTSIIKMFLSVTFR